MDSTDEGEIPTLEDEIEYQLPIEVWEHVFNFCNGMDICQMRLVCKDWKEVVQKTEPWNKISIRLNSIDVVQEFLTHIDTHGFQHLPVHSVTLEKLDDTNELKMILNVLGPHILCLNVISCTIFRTISSVELHNLERIQITWWDTPTSQVLSTDKWNLKEYKNLKAISCFWPDEIGIWGKNILFEMLDAGDTFQLEDLSFTYHGTEDVFYMKLVQLHAATLKHLQIRYNTKPFPRNRKNWEETFKSLINLKALLISGDCTLVFARLMFRSLPLEAPLSAVEIDGLFNADDELMAILIDKWTPTLESLCIRFNRCITMKSAKKIWRTRKNFQDLEVAFCNEFDAEELLAAVAAEKNFVMRRLSCHFLQNLRDDAMCQLASYLPHLEVLDLSNCYGAVKNKSLSWIFRYQTHLRVLNLSGSLVITDTAADYNEEPEWETYPITSLTNLETLSLKRCSHITTKFVNLIKLPYLRALHISGSKDLHFYDYRTIVQNCPALEELDVSSCKGFSNSALYYICDNLKRLTKLDWQNCKNISPKAIAYAETCIKKVEYSGVPKLPYKRLYGSFFESM